MQQNQDVIRAMALHDLLKKHRELIAYGIVGALTTLLNLAVYFALTSWLGVHYILADVFAWIICFVFSFVTNKLCVFGSTNWTFSVLLKEVLKFFTSSIFTGAVDVGLLYAMVDLLKINSTVSKLTDNVIIIILNYALRKLWVFRKTEHH